MNNPDFRAGTAGLLIGVLSWFGLFSWDHTIADSDVYGTWGIWQLSIFIIIAAVGSAIVAKRYSFGVGSTYNLALAFSFTALFALYARSVDVTGLWGVGAFVLVVGIMTILTVVAGLTSLIAASARKR